MRYEELTTENKLKCMIDYITVVCPYESDLSDASVEEVETSVKIALSLDVGYTIDESGAWYSYGEPLKG